MFFLTAKQHYLVYIVCSNQDAIALGIILLRIESSNPNGMKKYLIPYNIPDVPGSLGYKMYTLPETNIFAPEHGWLEYLFPFGVAYFQGRLPLVLGNVYKRKRSIGSLLGT